MPLITVLWRLALSVALNILAVITALLQYYAWHDMGGAIACFMGLAFAAWMVAPEHAHVLDMMQRIKAFKDNQAQ